MVTPNHSVTYRSHNGYIQDNIHSDIHDLYPGSHPKSHTMSHRGSHNTHIQRRIQRHTQFHMQGHVSDISGITSRATFRVKIRIIFIQDHIHPDSPLSSTLRLWNIVRGDFISFLALQRNETWFLFASRHL